jgi:hypothetical protein
MKAMNDVLAQPVVIEEVPNPMVPVFKVSLDPGGNGTSSGKFDWSELGERYKSLSQQSNNNSIVVVFEPGTVRSVVTRAMLGLYEKVQEKHGRFYCSVSPQEQVVLGTSGFTNLPGIRLCKDEDRAIALAGALRTPVTNEPV